VTRVSSKHEVLTRLICRPAQRETIQHLQHKEAKRQNKTIVASNVMRLANQWNSQGGFIMHKLGFYK